jgi:glycosyltransferase involved in cell wall biosynthesis
VGGALFGEQAYEQSLRALVAERGMTDRVHFVGQRPDVLALMHAVDLMVHPSTAPEPFARTLIEAMLAGHPPIASACGGIPELIESEKNGFLFPPGDAVALRHIVQRLLASPDELARVSPAAGAHARAHFTKSAFVTATTAHLNAAAGMRTYTGLAA